MMTLFCLFLLYNIAQCVRLHCPQPEYFVVPGNQFYIKAKHANNPPTSQYEWKIVKSDGINLAELLTDGELEDTFLLYNSDRHQFGELGIELTIEHPSKKKLCGIKVLYQPAPFFGIDLGTTYSCIAYQLKEKETIIVPADHSNRQEYCIPTAIYFPPNTDEILIGYDAKDKLVSDEKNVIYDIKRIIGRKYSDKAVRVFESRHKFVITEHNDNQIHIVIPNRNNITISPEQALAAIIIHLVKAATEDLNIKYDDTINVIISIPAFFNNAQRRAVRSVAQMAGITAKLLIVEPTAAALAYKSDPTLRGTGKKFKKDNFKSFMVFDFGGGTLDCSVLRCYGINCNVLAISGNSTLGGIDFDHVIKNMMIDKLTSLKVTNINESIILKDAEYVKLMLSGGDYEYKYKDKETITIEKDTFEQHIQTKQLLKEAIKTAKSVFTNTKFDHSNLRMILMIGGTSNLEIVQNELETAFSTTKIELPYMDPQLLVVTGGAVVAGSQLYDKVSVELMIMDVIPLALGFEVCRIINSTNQCGFMSQVVQKNTHYPIQVNKSYCQHTTDITDTTVTMYLYEGDSEYIQDNHFLSSLIIEDILPRKSMETCGTFHMVFDIDKHGIVAVKGVTQNEDETDNKIFNMSETISSNDASLPDYDIKIQRNEMSSWFKSSEIKDLLMADLDQCVQDIKVKNYVYLDSSGSMGATKISIGTEAFNKIAHNLMIQQTRISLFGSSQKHIVSWNDTNKWQLQNVTSEWKSYRGGSTYMWEMIRNDVINNHDAEFLARITVITDGYDTDSRPPYNSLQGMDAMMNDFLDSSMQIESNIIVLNRGKKDFDITRYRSLCQATGGLFYSFDVVSQGAEREAQMKKFEQEFVGKYMELNAVKRAKIREEQQKQYEENVKLGLATDFDWYRRIKVMKTLP